MVETNRLLTSFLLQSKTRHWLLRKFFIKSLPTMWASIKQREETWNDSANTTCGSGADPDGQRGGSLPNDTWRHTNKTPLFHQNLASTRNKMFYWRDDKDVNWYSQLKSLSHFLWRNRTDNWAQDIVSLFMTLHNGKKWSAFVRVGEVFFANGTPISIVNGPTHRMSFFP